MSEFMGLIAGDYDAKTAGGFRPAGASLHNIMSAHGPDAQSWKGASEAELKPVKVGTGSMAFMFESSLMVGVTEWGLKHCEKVQEEYNEESWEPLTSHFCPPSSSPVVPLLMLGEDGVDGEGEGDAGKTDGKKVPAGQTESLT